MSHLSNRFTISTIGLLYAILLLQCISCKKRKTPPPPPPKQAVIVLCDFTTSINSSKEDLKKNVRDAICALPPNTDYFFYQIHDGINRPFINGTVPGNSNNKGVLLHVASNNEGLVDSLYEADKSNFTCIRICLDAVKSKMNTFIEDTSYKKVHLLILSDMLECCPWDNGTVNLEKGRFKDATTILGKQAIMPLSSNSSKLKIGIILSTGKTLQYEHIKSFWDAYFQKAGYDKGVIWDMSISSHFFAN